MKKFGLLFGFVSVSAMVFISCQDFVMPKKISVKTDAIYEFPLGNTIPDLSDKISSEKIKENLTAIFPKDSNATVYEMDTDNLEYVLRYPIMEYEIGDITSMTGGLDLNSVLSGLDLSGINFNKTINVPAISVSTEKNIAKSKLEPEIKEKVGQSSFTCDAITIAETGSSSLIGFTTDLPTASVSFGEKVSAVRYNDNAKVKITITKKDSNVYGPDYELKVKAQIDQISDTYEFNGTSSAVVDISKSTVSVLELPLSDGFSTHALKDGFEIKFVAETKGGTLGNQHEYNITAVIEGDIEYLYGLTGVSIDLPFEQSVDVSGMDVDFIKSATLGSSSALTIQTEMPSEWESLSTKPSLNIDSFTMTGMGLNVSSISNVTGSGKLMDKKVDLSGKTITPSVSNKINVSGNIQISLDGVDIGYDDLPESINTSIKLDVSQFSSVTVDATKVIPGGKIEASSDLPEEVVSYVKSVEFSKNRTIADGATEDANGFGLKFKYTNTFDSDIPLSINVSPFGYEPSGATLAKRHSDETIDLTKDLTWTVKPSDNKLEYSVGIGDSSGDLVLSNVKLGQDYTLALSDVEFYADWNSVVINKSAISAFSTEGLKGDFDMSEFNLEKFKEENEALKDIIDNVEFKEMPMFIYASVPEGGENSLVSKFLSGGFEGKIYLEEEGSKAYNLISGVDGVNVGDIESSAVPVVNEKINWPASDVRLKPSDAIVSNNLTLKPLGEAHTGYSIGTDASKLLTGDYKKLVYDVNLKAADGDEITIYSYELKEPASGEEKKNGKISLEAAIRLPFTFHVKDGGISYDIKNLMGGDDAENTEPKDMFGRESASSMEEVAKYSDAIESIGISYKLTNKILPSFTGTVKFVAFEGTDHEIRKELGFTDGASREIGFSGSEVKTILTNYPFDPKITLEIPAGDYSISRSSLDIPNPISCDMSVKIKMSGESVTVFNMEEGDSK